MTSPPNKDVIRRNFEIVAAGEADRAAEVVTGDYINHESGRQPPECRVPGPAGLAAAIRWLNSIFSDVEFSEQFLICEGDLAAFHGTLSGRHTGAAEGMPPTGRRVWVRQTHMFRLSDGKIAEHWMTQDDLSLLEQLRGDRNGPQSAV